MPAYWWYVATVPLLGISQMTMLTAADATIQTSIDPALRGRVMAVYMMVVNGSAPIGAPIIGWVADTWGPRWTLYISGIVTCVTVLVVGIWAMRSWKLRMRLRMGSRPWVEVVTSDPS
jgi:MFS family permease